MSYINTYQDTQIYKSEDQTKKIKKNNNISPKDCFQKLSFKNGQQRASLTMEAAFVFPLFFFSIYLFWKCFLLILLELAVGKSVLLAGLNLGEYGYAERCVYEDDAGSLAWLYEPFIYGSLPDSNLASNWKVQCEYIQNKYYLQISYDFLMESLLFRAWKIPVTQTFQLTSYLGVYDADLYAAEEKPKEDIVYVTKNGSVYHESLSCTYLRTNVRHISSNEIENARNQNGAKYKLCDYCKNKSDTGQRYITTSGTKYHYSLQCSSIHRDVKEVSRENINLPACSKCGNVNRGGETVKQ